MHVIRRNQSKKEYKIKRVDIIDIGSLKVQLIIKEIL